MSPDDFVALALAAPIESGRALYGYAMRVASDNKNPPGVIALTWITGRDGAERQRIRDHAHENVADFLEDPGFISIVTGFIGLRGFTVTAWEDETSMRRALGKHHAEAMRELFGEDFVASVWTSVWTPGRINHRCVRGSSPFFRRHGRNGLGGLENARGPRHRTVAPCTPSSPFGASVAARTLTRQSPPRTVRERSGGRHVLMPIQPPAPSGGAASSRASESTAPSQA